jgi:hypothetical protein
MAKAGLSVALGAALALGVAPGAGAAGGGSTQTSLGVPFGPGLRAETDVPVRSTGKVVVSFHGDPATGCAARGLCGYSGTDTLDAGARGDLLLGTYRRHGRTEHDALLMQPPPARVTSAIVADPGGGACSDAPGQFADLFDASLHGARVTLVVLDPGGSVLATRCAGPLDSDVLAAFPRVTVPVGTLLRGRKRLDLGGTREFAGDGFAGTVNSTVAVQLGRPRHIRGGEGGGLPPGFHFRRMRIVTQSLTLTRLGGSLAGTFRSSSGCGPLGACGAQGTLGLSPSPSGASGVLAATGPVNAPLRDFLAALHGGHRRGIDVGGGVEWRDRSLERETFGQSGACNDTAPVSRGSVFFDVGRRAVHARYVVDGTLRTRCPGPMIAGVVASGAGSPAALAGRSFTLRLTGTRFADRGYAGTFEGSIALTLRRGRISQDVEALPTG